MFWLIGGFPVKSYLVGYLTSRCCVYRPETQQKAPVSAPPPPPPPPPPPEPAGPPEPEEEILGSDDEEQEDPADYCKGQNDTQTERLKSSVPAH